ncbi:MAG TPA: hypothetical protein DCS09_11720 [Porphyromonadaceae bacterium]|nr:hypothetical protein [Porphyromonadaceae bacterium]
MDKILPPLPPSDADSLARNKFDPQFQVGARDFWKHNHTEHITLKEPKKCEHYFTSTTDGVACKKCRMGWVGKELEVRDGNLYIQNKRIEI